MATRDTGGGQQKATRTREETEEVEASVEFAKTATEHEPEDAFANVYA